MANENRNHRSRSRSFVITPGTVPKFVIPAGLKTQAKSSTSARPLFERCVAYGEPSPSESASWKGPPTNPLEPIRVRLDSYRQPAGEWSKPPRRPDTIDGYSDSDPGYKLAMSLRHIPTKASAYGFVTLASKPRTTRRESLYFPRGNSTVARLRSGDLSAGLQPSEESDTSAASSCPSPVPAPADSSCLPPLLEGELSDVESHDENSVTREIGRSWEKASRHRRLGIRPSGLPGRRDKLGDDSPDADCSSLEDSPRLRPRHRRSHRTTGNCETAEAEKEFERAVALQQLHMRCVRVGPIGGDLGGLEVALRYDAQSRRLWVLLIRGENLGQESGLPPKRVCSFVKLQLRAEQGGEYTTQTSATVRKTRDPFYNEEFAFHGVGRAVVRTARLRLKVCRERPGLPSARVGEVWLDLLRLEREGFAHCHADLKRKHHFERKDPKRLHIALSYRPNTRCLMVVVVEAENVNSHPFLKGCRVEIEVTQVGPDGAGLVTETARTRPHHGRTASLVFREAFSFRLNETQNIRDGLAVVCRVVLTKPGCGVTLRGRRRGASAPVGAVRLGVGSTLKTEKDHWNTLLRRLGRQTMQWHTLAPC